MSTSSPVMTVITDAVDREFANQIANSLGYPAADVVVGSPRDAAATLRSREFSPNYIVIDIGDRGFDILPELDEMAEFCHENTRVVLTGTINDVTFYRELRQRGVIEYFTRPAKISDIRTALMYDAEAGRGGQRSSVITFMSSASGDGASTVAQNVAYCLAKDFRQSTVIIDMDFQFGMVARSLDLSSPFGIKELFEHPERSIDATLIDRMLVEYAENLKVIASPTDLRFWPDIRPEMIRDLVLTLQQRFDFIIIDLPHIWTTWVAAAISEATHSVLVGQLWLRSLTHSARLLAAWRDVGIDMDKISVVINRSGAKFKEAVSPRDFERICGLPIHFYLANDIKTIVAAENQGKTVPEVGISVLSRQFRELAAELLATHKGAASASRRGSDAAAAEPKKAAGISLGSLFNKK